MNLPHKQVRIVLEMLRIWELWQQNLQSPCCRVLFHVGMNTLQLFITMAAIAQFITRNHSLSYTKEMRKHLPTAPSAHAQ